MQYIEGIERLIYLYNEDGWNFPLVTFIRAFRILSSIDKYPDKIGIKDDDWKYIIFTWENSIRDPLFLNINDKGIELYCKKKNGEQWSSSVEDNMVYQLDNWMRFANG